MVLLSAWLYESPRNPKRYVWKVQGRAVHSLTALPVGFLSLSSHVAQACQAMTVLVSIFTSPTPGNDAA